MTRAASDPSDRYTHFSYALRALGRGEPPESFQLAGTTFARTEIVKHDFWAATAFYVDQRNARRRAVLKVGRTQPFCGFSFEWIGRGLCRREARFYKATADLPNVPAFLGFVGRTGFVHAFVDGKPLSKERPVPDGFFRELQDLFAALHARRIAYVDANKPQNILQGDDGRPHLIDFQISFDLHGPLGDFLTNRWFLRRLQAEDDYHILKHKKRMRPDELTPDEQDRVGRVSTLIRFHRAIAAPFRKARRRTFKHMKNRGTLLPAGSE